MKYWSDNVTLARVKDCLCCRLASLMSIDYSFVVEFRRSIITSRVLRLICRIRCIIMNEHVKCSVSFLEWKCRPTAVIVQKSRQLLRLTFHVVISIITRRTNVYMQATLRMQLMQILIGICTLNSDQIATQISAMLFVDITFEKPCI